PHDALDDLVVDILVDDGARAGRALLTLEAEGGDDDALDGRVDVGLVVDDDGVLAAHLGGDALEVLLAGLELRGALVDADADGLGAGEGHETGLRVVDERVADLLTAAGQEVDDAGR